MADDGKFPVPGSAARDAAQAGLRAQGLRTRTRIVRAATKLLLESGGLDFTLRAVARQAKISISNLQYYFPDRQGLLRAVMAPVIEAYLLDIDRVLTSGAASREMIDAIVERALRDAKDEKTMALTWHFASLALVDPECSRLYDEWYEALVRGIGKLIEKANPDLGAAVSHRLAMILTALTDGLGFQMRAGRERGTTRELEASYRTVVEFLLRENLLGAGPKRAGKAASR